MPNPTFSVYLNAVPAALDGPKILRAVVPLVAVGGGAGAVVDLSADASLGNLRFVQALFLDTGDFGYTLTVTHRAIGFRTRVRTNTQGWYPIACNDALVFDLSAPAGAVGSSVPLWFTNVAMPAAQWQTA